MEVTEIVVDHIGASEVQLNSNKDLHHRVNYAPKPGASHQKATHRPAHDVSVVKGFTDGT